MGRLEGKVAFITGAGAGIGRASAQKFVTEGARVVVAELNPETGKATAAALGDAVLFGRFSQMKIRMPICRNRKKKSLTKKNKRKILP